jgi:hypothetical protein
MASNIDEKLMALLDTFIYYGKESRREEAKQKTRAETFEQCRVMLEKALEVGEL